MSSEIAIDTKAKISRPRAPSNFRHPIVAILLGIVVPLLCLWIDPIIFDASIGQPPLAGSYTHVCLGYMSLAMFSLAAWLISHRLPSVFTGLLFGGWAFSLLLGLALLPLSIIGLLLLIGILGLSPFLTAATFWHCAKQAREVAGARFNRVVAVFALLLYVTVPPVADAGIRRLTTSWIVEITTGSDQSAAQATGRLKLLGPLFDTDVLVQEFNGAFSTPARERLAKVYLDLTGDTIEKRRAVLDD